MAEKKYGYVKKKDLVPQLLGSLFFLAVFGGIGAIVFFRLRGMMNVEARSLIVVLTFIATILGIVIGWFFYIICLIHKLFSEGGRTDEKIG